MSETFSSKSLAMQGSPVFSFLQEADKFAEVIGVSHLAHNTGVPAEESIMVDLERQNCSSVLHLFNS